MACKWRQTDADSREWMEISWDWFLVVERGGGRLCHAPWI